MRSCAEVHEPIKLLFGMVSGDSQGMGILHGGPYAPREWAVSRFFAPIGLNWAECIFWHRNVFDWYVKG